MKWRLSIFSKRDPGGFKEDGVLTRKEFAAGLRISRAVQKGFTTLTPEQQEVLRVFQDGVGCAPRRTAKLTDEVIKKAVAALSQQSQS